MYSIDVYSGDVCIANVYSGDVENMCVDVCRTLTLDAYVC